MAVNQIAPDCYEWQLELKTKGAENSAEVSLDGTTTSEQRPPDLPLPNSPAVHPSDGRIVERQALDGPVESLPSGPAHTDNTVAPNARLQVIYTIPYSRKVGTIKSKC